jgi:transcriptional regulator with XRE-family HTH domain
MKDLQRIGERLRLFLENEKIRPNTLARLSENSSTQIYNILNGRKYGTDKLLQIINALPTINIVWLLFGEGAMHTNQTNKNTQSSSEDSARIAGLEKQIENLQALVNLQEITVHAYKRSAELAEASVADLKRIANFYKDKTDDFSTKKSA